MGYHRIEVPPIYRPLMSPSLLVLGAVERNMRELKWFFAMESVIRSASDQYNNDIVLLKLTALVTVSLAIGVLSNSGSTYLAAHVLPWN